MLKPCRRDVSLAGQLWDHIENIENVMMESIKQEGLPDSGDYMLYDIILAGNNASELKKTAPMKTKP